MHAAGYVRVMQTHSDAQAELMQTPAKQPKLVYWSLILVFQKQHRTNNSERMAVIRQEIFGELSGYQGYARRELSSSVPV